MIVVECHTDKFFITNLGFPKKQVKHESCKGDVINNIMKNSNCVGIVDHDPGTNQPSKMEFFKIETQESDITLFKQIDNENIKLIQISPNLESWFIKRARQNRINLHDFKLVDTYEALHTPHIEKNRDFQKFLLELIRVDKEFAVLKKWLKEANKNP